MRVINLFAGPGTGKSTTAAGLFYLLKLKGINCELVHEEAKEFTWEERQMTLGCQPYIFAKQMRNLWRLKGKVDYAITDSPILLSLAYAVSGEWPASFNDYVVDQFNAFENVNFFLTRSKPYQMVGRSQSFEEAIALDRKIIKILLDNDVSYATIPANDKAPQTLETYLKLFDEKP